MFKILLGISLLFLPACGSEQSSLPPANSNGAVFLSLLHALSSSYEIKQQCPLDAKDKTGKEYDIGQKCTDAFKIHSVGDSCSSFPPSHSINATLNHDDIDLFSISFDDSSGAFCDVFGDSFAASIQLDSAPPGVMLCVRPESNNRCQDQSLDYNASYCRGTKWALPGIYGSNNSLTVSAWVRWHPQATPQCASYSLSARAASV